MVTVTSHANPGGGQWCVHELPLSLLNLQKENAWNAVVEFLAYWFTDRHSEQLICCWCFVQRVVGCRTLVVLCVLCVLCSAERQ